MLVGGKGRAGNGKSLQKIGGGRDQSREDLKEKGSIRLGTTKKVIGKKKT